MQFDDRELPAQSAPVRPDQLKTGQVYWAVKFVDQAMLIPLLEPRVFIGRDLEDGEPGELYFQDAQSYFSASGAETAGAVVTMQESDMTYLFEFDAALHRLLLCWQRQKGRP
jgi:hypothetical protein